MSTLYSNQSHSGDGGKLEKRTGHAQREEPFFAESKPTKPKT